MSAPATPRFPRVVIVPGNGCTPVRECNWYHWLDQELRRRGFTDVVLRDMPDPHVARAAVWLPFLAPACDAGTIVVGHSSGAQAALRLCETVRVLGIVLVSACVTDLGDANERASGYYNRPWEWDQLKANTKFISQVRIPLLTFKRRHLAAVLNNDHGCWPSSSCAIQQ